MFICIYGYVLCYLANSTYYTKLYGITDIANTLGYIYFNSLASFWEPALDPYNSRWGPGLKLV